MNKKTKILIATGGTGGHIFPAYSLATYFDKRNYDVEITTDKRGYLFLKNYKDLKIKIISSSPLIKKNILTLISSILLMLLSFIKSLIYLIFNRPKIVFGTGGYSSFPICLAAWLLNLEFIIYENNLIIGKANRYLLPFAKKLFVSNKNIEGIPFKYKRKEAVIGNLLRNEILNFKRPKKDEQDRKILKILILGGSQAAKVFAEKIPKILKKCKDSNIPLKIYQQCLINQNKDLMEFYKNSNIDSEIFNFTHKITSYFEKANLVITRSGASILGELINVNIPFISIPLPTSAENHQFKNAIYFEKKNLCYLVEEKDLNLKLYDLIKSLFVDKSLLDRIKSNQSQYSDKNVFQNIHLQLEKIINEKN